MLYHFSKVMAEMVNYEPPTPLPFWERGVRCLLRIKKNGISSLVLNSSPQVLSGFVSEKNRIGYEFKAKKEDQLDYINKF
jgi:hypothetical protein